MVKLATAMLFAACTLGVLGWKPAGHVHNFSELPAGNVLQVHFHSSGCFNQNDYVFTFRPGSVATVDVVENNRVGGPRTYAREPLSADDLRKLDGTLRYYRNVKGDGCTTVDTLTVTELHGKQVVATETYRDATCQAWDKKNDILLFQTLYSRIAAEKNPAP